MVHSVTLTAALITLYVLFQQKETLICREILSQISSRSLLLPSFRPLHLQSVHWNILMLKGFYVGIKLSG